MNEKDIFLIAYKRKRLINSNRKVLWIFKNKNAGKWLIEPILVDEILLISLIIGGKMWKNKAVK
jgi:hypothetical protein